MLAGRRDEVVRRLAADGLDPADGARFACLDVAGGTVTPGLIDPHTHLVFAGSRESEIELRRRGATYLEILAAGGGILSTVAATRRASVDELAASGRRWLREMLRHGATTVEAKSGYGLERDAELRQLEAIGRLDAEGPAELVPTFLGAHAVAPEFRDRPDATDAYVRDVIDVQLPAVAAQGIARFCDVFCEQGVFTAEQSRQVLLAGARLGLGLRLHADELRPSGGAELAAELGAAGRGSPRGAVARGDRRAGRRRRRGNARGRDASADDESLPEGRGVRPGPRADRPRRAGRAGHGLQSRHVAGAQPPAGSLARGADAWGSRRREALAGVTVNAAHALRLGDSHGTIEPGRQADLVAWDVPGIGQIPYWLGAGLVRAVVKRGRVVAFD